MHRVISCLGLVLLLAGCSETATRADQKVPLEQGVGDGPDTKLDHTAGSDVLGSDGPGSDGPATCQPTTKKVEEFAPKANAVAGWGEDLIPPGTAGLETGYSDGDIEGIINGEQDPYAGKTDGFVREHYRKGDASLVLQLWDLKSAQDAKALFEANKKKDETMAGIVYTDIPDAAERSVLGDNKPIWKVWGHKCDYHWKIYACGTLPSSATCDPTSFDTIKPDVIAFVQYLTKQLP